MQIFFQNTIPDFTSLALVKESEMIINFISDIIWPHCYAAWDKKSNPLTTMYPIEKKRKTRLNIRRCLENLL